MRTNKYLDAILKEWSNTLVNIFQNILITILPQAINPKMIWLMIANVIITIIFKFV